MSNGEDQQDALKPWEKYKGVIPSGLETKPWLKYKPSVETASSIPLKPLQQTQPKTDTRGQEINKTLEGVQGAIQKWRPRWDTPSEILKDPTWYGRSAKYFGGGAIGTGKAGAGVLTGGVKILNDLYSSLDPSEYYQRGSEPLKELSSDAYSLEKGMFYDLPKATYDLVRHFPESAADPEQFGSTIMNLAAVVDGGLKGAKAITEHLFPEPLAAAKEATAKVGELTKSQQAQWAALQASKKPVADKLRWRAIEDNYVHKNGVGVAKDLVKSDKAASDHVKLHSNYLDEKIPKTDGVDTYTLGQEILDAHKDIVKTPDPLNSTLNELLTESKKLTPGKMPFTEARAFRSKVGAAFRNAKGANIAVLGRIYDTLTKQLRDITKKYKLEGSWDQYNELEKKRHVSFPLLEKARQIVNENGEGASMASALKSEAATKEVVKSLSKYGLDADKVTKYSAKANRIIRERPSENQRLTSYIYKVGPGTVPAIAGLAAGKALASAAGAGSEGWIAGLGLGAAAGWATVYLTHALRAQRLAPEILDSILDSREWPGRMKLPEGEFPSESSTEDAPPTTPKPSPKPKPSPIPQLPAAPATKTPEGPTAQQATMPQPTVPSSISYEAKAAQAAEETKTSPTTSEPKVTKLAPEEGSRATKQRERVAKVRKEKGSTALGGGTQEISGGGAAQEELKKAEARTNTPHVDASKMDVVDLERQLQGLDKKKFKEAINLRKQHQLSSEDYKGVLEFYFTEAMEDKLRKE